MSNAQIGGLTSFKMTARGILRGVVIPHAVKKEILQGIEDINMPLFKYCNASDEQIKGAFVKEVLSAVGSKVDFKVKAEIKSRLLKKFR